MEGIFRQNGWALKNDHTDASLILFNACGLTNGQEQQSLQIIDTILSKKRSGSQFFVWGCLPKINPELLRTVYQGPFFGSDEPRKICQYIALKKPCRSTHANYLVPHTNLSIGFQRPNFSRIMNPLSILHRLTSSAYRRYGNTVNLYNVNSFVIKTSTGCKSKCTYCAVRISRGSVKSKPMEQIEREFRDGLNRGYTEFSLIATDVGSYGMDIGCVLTDLLDRLTTLNGDFKIRIRNIQPKFLLKMLPEMKRILKRGKISFIGATAQSGSDKVLKRMGRGYCIDDYKRAIFELKSAYPKLMIRSQLMVGFPGETDEDFNASLRLIDDVNFDFVETFHFQPRVGTAAARMPDQIPEKIAVKRHNRLFLKIISQSEMGRELGLPVVGQKALQFFNSCYRNDKVCMSSSL
jgi:MiaB/RimO family radical SAM methylthiotransferase